MSGSRSKRLARLDARGVDRRLVEWAGEFGGGKHANLGYPSRNILDRLGEPRGGNGRIACAERTPADHVESLVRKMETNGMAREAAILRCEYFRPQISMPHRMDLMRSAGHGMSRETYGRGLELAFEYVGLNLSLKP